MDVNHLLNHQTEEDVCYTQTEEDIINDITMQNNNGVVEIDDGDDDSHEVEIAPNLIGAIFSMDIAPHLLNYGGEVAAAVELWWTARDGSGRGRRQLEVTAVVVRRLLVMQLTLELEMVKVLVVMVCVDVVVMVDCWMS
ncbi:hypothetical protein Dsin_032268 [Dipteronia sinensis]|uniref:Uncharacterized protein n=1 Tax=Dipteronia sinensis TaxID=43782 RepID=A0AAE0DT67_9ROSI|nr:hypothetical protein Dsin_032268 [Dipteronia sinensis]